MRSTLNHESTIHHAFDAREIGQPFKLGRDYALDELDEVCRIHGIGVSPSAAKALASGVGMDTIQQLVTTASVPTAIQFLQNWLPGLVEVVTAARKIDEIVGIATVGSWEDEQIVQQVLENVGTAVPYGDTTNVPLANWNLNFVYRTVVRYEQGLRVGNLEEARASRVRVNSGDQKRRGSALNLEIQRNAVGLYGYNSGNNLTYGYLNDPNLPAYVTVATVSGNTTWAQKTFLQIQGDLLTGLQALRNQSKDTIEPNKTPITLAVATSCVDYLAKTSDFGISVYDWLKQFYPNVRVVSAPQLNSANGGSNVFYLHADTVADSGTDDQRTFIQVVPAKFQLLGIQKGAKSYEEDYSNATAGVMCKRPYAVVRYSGI